MTHLDQMIADALAQSPDTVVHQLASEVVRLRAEIADLKRGAVVVPEDVFTLDLDTQKGKSPRITIKSKKRGLGYDLCSGNIDGHFSRRSYNITPYMRPFLETVGIRPIPADRVLGEGVVAVDRDYLADLEEAIIDTVESLDRGFVLCENCGEQEETKSLDVMSMNLLPMKERIDALRAQPTQEPTT